MHYMIWYMSLVYITSTEKNSAEFICEGPKMEYADYMLHLS